MAKNTANQKPAGEPEASQPAARAADPTIVHVYQPRNPNSVRCKFQVCKKEEFSAPGGNVFWNVFLNPAYPKQDAATGQRIPSENDLFWSATPGGEMRLGSIGPEAAARFEVGKEYYIDFTSPELDEVMPTEEVPAQ